MKKTIAIIISFMLVLSSLFVMLDMAENAEGKEIAPAPFAGGTFGGGNGTVWNNSTIDGSEDSDGDGWTDAEEVLAGTDPEDATDQPVDTDGDGIADFMDTDFLTTEVPVYNNNTIWNNGTVDPQTETVTETPAWAWGAVIAAVVLGILVAVGFMRGGKTPIPKETPDTEDQESEEPQLTDDQDTV